METIGRVEETTLKWFEPYFTIGAGLRNYLYYYYYYFFFFFGGGWGPSYKYSRVYPQTLFKLLDSLYQASIWGSRQGIFLHSGSGPRLSQDSFFMGVGLGVRV